jgi:hypothetical protein
MKGPRPKPKSFCAAREVSDLGGLLSLLAAWCAQLAVDLGLPAPRVVWILAPGSERAIVSYEYQAQWAAGDQVVVWRPEGSPLKAEQAGLSVQPADGVVIREAAQEANEMRWAVRLPAPGRYLVTVQAPLADLRWAVAATGRLAEGRLLCQPQLILENTGGATLRADVARLQVSPAEPVRVVAGPLELASGEKLQVPLQDSYQLQGHVVVRFQAPWTEVRRVMVLDTAAASAALSPWRIAELALLDSDQPARTVRLTVSPQLGAEADLGPTAEVAVRRVLREERRDNLDFDRYGRVQGFDTIETYRLEALNLTDRPVDLEVVEERTSAWEIKAALPVDTSRPNLAVLHLRLAAGQRAEHQYAVVKHAGTRAE